MEGHISELLDGLENAGQPIKPRGGGTARVKALTLARLRREEVPARPACRRLRPLTAAAAVLAAVLLLSGTAFAAWKLGIFRFGEYFGPEGEVLDAYAQTYEPDPSGAVPVIRADTLQTKEEFEAYARPVFALSAETKDYRFSLHSLTASGTVLYAVMDVEGLSDFGRANLGTAPEFALHNTTHHAGGIVLDARPVESGENVQRWLFGIATVAPINEVGDVINFETLSLYEEGGWSDCGYRLFDVRLERLIPEKRTLTDPQGEPADSIRWKELRVDAVSLSLQGDGSLAAYGAACPRVTLVFRDGTREEILQDGWQPGAAPGSDHEAVCLDMVVERDLPCVSLIFASPLDPQELAEVLVDGQVFSFGG